MAGRGLRRPDTRPYAIYEAPRIPARPGEEIVPSARGHNCGGRCAGNAPVQGGRVVRIRTDPRKWTPEAPPLTACVRGSGAVERVYHPERLLHPLRQTGSRNADQWKRTTWADALAEVARQVRCVRENRRVIDRRSFFELDRASEGKGLVGELRSS